MRPGRVVVLLVVTVVLQVALFPHLRLDGRVPDLGLVVAVAVAFDHGPEAGAIVGFFAGLGFDLFLETPLGLVGARVRAHRVRGRRAARRRVADAEVVHAGDRRRERPRRRLLFVGVGLLAGVDAVHGNQAFATVVLTAVYDALLAPFVFIVVGVWLRHVTSSGRLRRARRTGRRIARLIA